MMDDDDPQPPDLAEIALQLAQLASALVDLAKQPLDGSVALVEDLTESLPECPSS